MCITLYIFAQVRTLISCVRALKPATIEKPSLSSPSPLHPPTASVEESLYHSAYMDPEMESASPKRPHLLAASMYHSAFGTLSDDDQEKTGISPSRMSSINSLRLAAASVRSRKKSSMLESDEAGEEEDESDVCTDWEEYVQRAAMKKLSAQLSINEALLTISSLGRTVTEISVPGLKVEFLKRPYDSATRLLVQDLCIVDRIQTFGPEYELVVCSSGRSLLGFSPLDASISPSPSNVATSPFEKAGEKSSTAELTQDKQNAGSKSKTLLDSISPDLFDQSKEEMSGALCVMKYTHLGPLSPEHPAVKDLEREDICVDSLGMEPNIHRINLQCTAIDAIGELFACMYMWLCVLIGISLHLHYNCEELVKSYAYKWRND